MGDVFDRSVCRGRIVINVPTVIQSNDKTRVTTEIDFNGQKKTLWFEVGSDYSSYLCPERGDGFVIAMLWLAMRNGYDIVSKVPVTAELMYQIETWLIPALVKHSQVMYPTKIEAEQASELIPNEGAVGTGISCGIDSLHSLKENLTGWKGRRLTHLAIYNVGAFGNFDENKRDSQFEWQISNAQHLCNEVGLKLVVANSNLKADFWSNFCYTHTYCNVFAVYMLQKLWGTYFYASAGLDMTAFSVVSADSLDASHYDIYSLPCFSTRGLKLYSEGSTLNRFEKTSALVDWEPASRYLHVCCYDEGRNCGRCFKCRRTLVTLDALNRLDQFGGVFDVGYYKNHRPEYLKWLVLQSYNRSGEEWAMVAPVYDKLKSEISIWCHVAGFGAFVGQCARDGFRGLRERLRKIKILRDAYVRLRMATKCCS